MEEKEIYNQLICNTCKGALIPVYNVDNKNLKLLCINCNEYFNVPIMISLTEGMTIYEEDV